MAYLGITDGDYKGLYYFDSLSVRDKVGENFDKPKFYTNGQKAKALKEFNIDEDSIIDGGDIVRRLRKAGKYIPTNAAFLAITGSPYQGVYFFNSEKMRDMAAGFFGGLAVIAESQENAIKACKLPRIHIQDGGILLSNECRAWRRGHHHLIGGKPKYAYDEKPTLNVVETPKVEKEAPNEVEESKKVERPIINAVDTTEVEKETPNGVNENKKAETHIEDTVEGSDSEGSNFEKSEVENVNDSSDIQNLEDSDKNLVVREIISQLSENTDIIEITMSNGLSYFLTVNELFYAPPEEDFSKAIVKNELGEESVDGEKISDMIDDGIITAICKSEVEYKGNFIILNKVDDTYSPNPLMSDSGHTYFVHGVNKVVINISQIVSIMPVNDFNDMTWKQISSENFAIISDFMYENYTVAN